MIKTGLGNKGFSITEVMVVGLIMSVVLFASSQATIIFVKRMVAAEKKLEAVNESQDLSMYVRRSSKNLTTGRINMPTTFLLVRGSDPVTLGANAVPPKPSLTIEPALWLASGNSNPFYSAVQSAITTPTYDVFLDSFTLEEHALKGTGNSVRKITRRLLVSRCGDINDIFSLNGINGPPAVTALYVLGVMDRRPFISYKADGKAEINCCPVTNPKCSSGPVQKSFFKTYSISFNDAQRVVGVEEFPKPNEDNPVLGSGFGLYFANTDGSNVSIQTFTVENRCKTMVTNPPPICSERGDIKTFLQATQSNSSLLKIDTRSISTTLSNDIAKTGVIAL